MPVVAGLEILGMRPAVHVDDSVGVGTANVHDEDPLEIWKIHELDAVRRQELTSSARRFAARVRLELRALPVLVQRAGPRLKGHFTKLGLFRRAGHGGTGEPTRKHLA